MIQTLIQPVRICYDNGDGNDNNATKPEFWSHLGLMLLESKSTMANLVHRSFENDVAEAGDVVHTYRPNSFRIRRKKDTGEVEEQDATSERINVPLNQHIYSSFIIKDREWSLNAKDLVALHLPQAVSAIARGIDRAVTGFATQAFIKTPSERVGRLGGLSSSNTRQAVIEANEKFDLANVPDEERRLLLNPRSRTHFLDSDFLVSADKSGDQANAALRNAFLGELFGFDTFKSNNMASVTNGSTDTVSGTVTGALAAEAQTADEAVTITGYEVVDGEWVTISGNDQPQYATAATGTTNTTGITLNEAQKYASSAGAEIIVYRSCLANGTYAVDHEDDIIVDGHTANKGPQVGQLLAIGTGVSRKVYTIVEATAVSATSTSILLDRPLEAELTDNASVFPGPAGVFNVGFHRDSIALVTRPLVAPRSVLGVDSHVAVSDNMGLRVTMQYDSKKQGTRVTVDVLAGLAMLNDQMGTLILG